MFFSHERGGLKDGGMLRVEPEGNSDLWLPERKPRNTSWTWTPGNRIGERPLDLCCDSRLLTSATETPVTRYAGGINELARISNFELL